MRSTTAACLCAALAASAVPGGLTAQDKGLLPGNAVWAVHIDDTLDGKIQSPRSNNPWRILVKNNMLTGTPLRGEEKGKAADGGKANRGTLTGEVVAGQNGKPAIVSLREDNSTIKGYTMFLNGRLVEEGRIVGTWYDTYGQAGDFEFVREKNK